MEKPKAQMGKMIERKKTDLRSQSGFTLLEMMSVLVILGVIFSVTIKKFTAGWANDPDVFKALDTKLGAGFRWNPAANELGGALHFGNHIIALTRIQSTDKSAASWQ